MHRHNPTLQSCPKSLVKGTIQTQKVRHLAEMINAPETLRGARGVRALEPRQPKRARME